MDQAKDTLRKSNPLRSDISWPIILVQGSVALGIGLYALLAEENARKNLVFLIGLFLLANGVFSAVGGLRRHATSRMAPYQLLRAGIGLATGAIVVINRIAEFMSLDSARVVIGIGLLGIGCVTIIGLVAVRKEKRFRPVAFVGPLLLVVWGFVCLYQVANDKTSVTFLGWTAVIIGVALLALALFRRQRASAPTAPASA